jgi:hypothetical protein
MSDDEVTIHEITIHEEAEKIFNYTDKISELCLKDWSRFGVPKTELLKLAEDLLAKVKELE